MQFFAGFFVIIAVISATHGSSLQGKCTKNDECDVVDSYCNNGVCACSQDFATHDGACIQVIKPTKSCTLDTECHATLGDRSICKDGSCACIPYHNLHSNSVCVKNRGLNEKCTDEFKCYWGEDMLSTMDCISGECTCKSGYRPWNNRKCVSGAPISIASGTSVVAALILLLIAKLV